MPLTTRQPLGVIILAAGASRRMGRPKLLLPWQDSTVIGHIIHQWQDLDALQIAIVHRPKDASLLAELDRLNFPAQNRIENPAAESGMFSSVLCAANWPRWAGEVASWAIVLGDQPHLRLDTLRAATEFHFERPHAICQPLFDGHGRHPVFLPRQAFHELKTTHAQTLKDFLKLIARPIVQYPVDDPGLALDMDTPGDYKQLLNLASAK
jgi:molybdenum cofactor cytidylyltransferase